MKTNHYVKVTGLFLLCFFSLYFFFRVLNQNPEAKKSSLVQRKSPDFKALLFDESSEKSFASLKDYKGKPLVLSFWASWCTVCHSEGEFLELKRKILKKQKSDVSFLRVAVSTSLEGARRAWLKNIGQNPELMPTAFDDGDMIVEFGLTGVPETFFVDRKGFVAYRHRGPLTEEIFDRYLEQISRPFNDASSLVQNSK